MPTFKEITAADIKTSRSVLNQLVDVIQNDVSSSSTRKTYQVFVTGVAGSPGVTSSLFQTVFDQDYTLQTANEVLDLTVGLFSGSATVASASTGVDSAGKLLFVSQSLMMREKINIYRQYAQTLLGDADLQFTAPFSNSPSSTSNNIDEALFINIKRLFARDRVKPQTFAMNFYMTGVLDAVTTGEPDYSNVNRTSTSGSSIFTDAGQPTQFGFGGQVGDVALSTNSNNILGNFFYDQGIIVLDAKKIISGTQHVSGVISAVSTTSYRDAASGQTIIGTAGSGNQSAKFIPDFFISGSVDDIVKHFATCRFSSGSLTAMTFQNNTNINSTLVFCRATADEFNYSSNPTFTDTDGKIVVIDDPTTDRTFSYITTVGLYDANDNLLAVAKMSRPIEKNDEKDLTFRVRLDF